MPWTFSEVCRVGPSGGVSATSHRDIRSLISDHLRLVEADEPNLSIVEGVLGGGGRSKDSVRHVLFGRAK